MNLSLSQKHTLERLRDHLEEEIVSVDSKLLEEYPIESYVRELDQYEQHRSYRFVPPGIRLQCEETEKRFGLRGLELFHKLLLVSLIESCGERQKRYRLPNSIQSLLLREFDRILIQLEVAEERFYLHDNDLFAKDLGLCRLKLVPCGSEVVDLYSGVPRRTLFQGDISQFLGATFFLMMQVGGFSPLYESHWDRRLVQQFTQRGYDLCYVRIAELLRLNPKVKGMFGSSWWFDPQLRDIAPQLLFLRIIPEENGARFFHVGTDASTVKDAITFSKKRRTLYEAGKYIPCRFMMVWARNDILKWAERFGTFDKPLIEE